MVVVFGEGRAWSEGGGRRGVAMVIQVTGLELCLFVYAILPVSYTHLTLPTMAVV